MSELLQKFYNSTEFLELQKIIDQNVKILIVGNSNKKTECFYYSLWYKYYDKIDIYKYLYYNMKTKTNIRGKTNTKRRQIKNPTIKSKIITRSKKFSESDELKQILFISKKFLDIETKNKDILDRQRFYIHDFKCVPYLSQCPEKLISIENMFFNAELNHNINGNILVFDTETNGIPDKQNFRCIKYDYISDDIKDIELNKVNETEFKEYEKPYQHARMLSIGWIILDRESLNIINSSYYLVKDSKIKNSISAQQINKISDEDREKNGSTFTEIYSDLKKDLNNCGYIVCHGSDFDINVLCNEIQEHNLTFDILKNKCICNTKQNLYRQFNEHLSDIVKLKSDDKNNYPHNALYDSKLCAELFKIRIQK